MKRLFFIVFFVVSLLIASASAETWDTYRLPNEPNYIISVPSSYHVLYYGMPENSATLKALGITSRQAELSLEFNNAFALVYSNNFSSFMFFTKLDGVLGEGYENLSEESLERLAFIMEDAVTKGMQSDGTLVVEDSTHFIEETKYAKYIVIVSQIKMGVTNQYMTQCATSKNGNDIMITFNCLSDEYLEDDLKNFESILHNFILL